MSPGIVNLVYSAKMEMMNGVLFEESYILGIFSIKFICMNRLLISILLRIYMANLFKIRGRISSI